MKISWRLIEEVFVGSKKWKKGQNEYGTDQGILYKDVVVSPIASVTAMCICVYVLLN